MSATILQRTTKLLRVVRARFALYLLRLQYGKDTFPADMAIGSGVRVSISDGGNARFAQRSTIDSHATIVVKHGTLVVGARAYIGIGSLICARDSITIGSDVLIAEYVTIRDQDHNFGSGRVTAESGFSTAAIVIGNNVWLGAKVTITKGVTIGDNCVIGANSVVTQDIPANSVAGGVPAAVIRHSGSGESSPGATPVP